MTYVIKTRVIKVEEKTRVLRARKSGDDIITDRESLGWFILIDGSREALYIGMDKPTDLVDGQSIVIRIEPA